jgi:hypothetical protein
VELGGYRVLRNVLVVRRKRVAHQTEGADPNPGADVDGARQETSVHRKTGEATTAHTHMG